MSFPSGLITQGKLPCTVNSGRSSGASSDDHGRAKRIGNRMVRPSVGAPDGVTVVSPHHLLLAPVPRDSRTKLGRVVDHGVILGKARSRRSAADIRRLLSRRLSRFSGSVRLGHQFCFAARHYQSGTRFARPWR